MSKQKLTAEEKADLKKGKSAFLEMVRRLKKKGAMIGDIEMVKPFKNICPETGNACTYRRSCSGGCMY